MKADGTKILQWLLTNSARIRILEGGSRSSKTFSIIQFLILYCQDAASKGQIKRITIARQKLTWLKATLLNDFIEILRLYEIYNDNDFHKSEMRYNLFGSEIGFFGLDEPQKLHGRKQDVFWINEAIEATKDDFDQLEMRTTDFGILDFNPSATNHWIFDSVLTRPDVVYNHSTVLDNPFAPDEVKRKIFSYQPTEENIKKGTADENKWKIYGLGIRAMVEGVIFKNVEYVKELPNVPTYWIGLDFGFTNDPTAITKVMKADGKIWCKQLCYKHGLTNTDISSELNRLGINKSTLVVADSAEPKSIEELRRLGWNIIGVTKGQGSVNAGIDILKRYTICITEDSIEAKREAENYTWRFDRNTNSYLNIPIDRDNHFWDSVRFVAMECLGERGTPLPARKLGRNWKEVM